MEAGGYADEAFEVSSQPETATVSPQFEGANVCRAAAISTMLGGDRAAIAELAEPLGELGFADRLRSGEVADIDVDPYESLGDLWPELGREGAGSRIGLWQSLNDEGDPRAAVAFLVAVLGSPLERESAAAAAALWRQLAQIDRERLWRYARRPRWWFLRAELGLEERGWPWLRIPWFPGEDLGSGDKLEAEAIEWDPDAWTEFYRRAIPRRGDRDENLLLVDFLVRIRLAQALRSPDPITRALAAAIFPPADDPNGAAPDASDVAPARVGTGVSTLIHGTWGWKGDWWRPRPGSFHEFILDNHRENLYTEGARFSWSGAYSRGDREQAAIDFYDWATSKVALGGLETVFAHSYGGEVAARAITRGAPVNELVLLSVPVTRPVQAVARSGLRIVDVRLNFDPVLGLARKRQRLKKAINTTEVVLRRWRLSHSATHQPHVWLKEKVAERGQV